MMAIGGQPDYAPGQRARGHLGRHPGYRLGGVAQPARHLRLGARPMSSSWSARRSWCPPWKPRQRIYHYSLPLEDARAQAACRQLFGSSALGIMPVPYRGKGWNRSWKGSGAWHAIATVTDCHDGGSDLARATRWAPGPAGCRSLLDGYPTRATLPWLATALAVLAQGDGAA